MLPSYPFLSPPFIKPPPPQDCYNTILRLSSPPTLLFLVFSFIVLFFCYSKLLTMSKVLEAMGRAAERCSGDSYHEKLNLCPDYEPRGNSSIALGVKADY